LEEGIAPYKVEPLRLSRNFFASEPHRNFSYAQLLHAYSSIKAAGEQITYCSLDELNGSLVPEKPFLALVRPRQVAILRALQFGDLMCAVPALRALRQALPDAHIALIGLPWAKSFEQRFSDYLDEFIEFPGFPGLPELAYDAESCTRFFSEMQARRFDLIIQMQGNGIISNPCVSLMGGRRNAGFYLPGQYCPDPETFLPYPPHSAESSRLLDLVTHLGAEPAGEHFEFPLTDADRSEWESIAADRGLAGPLVCIHPGARDQRRRWSPAGFATLADRLAERGLQVVFTGVSEESDLVAGVRAAMCHPSVDLSGITSIGALACLLQDAALLVANDTGVRHLAAAVKTPSIVLVTGSDAERWAASESQRLLVDENAPANACRHTAEMTAPHRCLGDSCCAFEGQAALRDGRQPLSPEYVVREAEALLERS
jgi:ADP-heptose:LPS heptosyltransferase